MTSLRLIPRLSLAARCPPTYTSVARHARSLHSSQSARALQRFQMPAMSPTMTEGGIAQWKVKEGDAYSAGDVLLEIETDKATMDVEAQDDGVLAKIIAADGSKNVQVNSVIAITAEEGDDLSKADEFAAEAEKESASSGESESKPKEEEAPKAPEPESKPAPSEPKSESKRSPSSSSSSSSDRGPNERVFASPLARRLAQERGIPLAQIKGSGPNGRIIKEDIENYKGAPAGAEAASGAKSDAGSGTAAPQKGTSAPASIPEASHSAGQDYTDIPLSNMRRTIAGRLTASKQELPHYYVSIDIEMDRVLKLRELFNSASEKAAGGDKEKAKAAKLSVGDFVTKAASVALREVPEVNAAWYGDFIRQHHKADISIAVATPTGLITPIVKDVGGSGLSSISAQTKSLAAKARSNKLQPHEYQGGTFTISNMGMFGISHFTAIINPPQAAILAIGGTEKKVLPAATTGEEGEDKYRTANVMQATISADHRVVDGATAARWMKAFKDALENPLSFML